MNLETYPQRIVKPLIELEKTSDLAAEHKLRNGESIKQISSTAQKLFNLQM